MFEGSGNLQKCGPFRAARVSKRLSASFGIRLAGPLLKFTTEVQSRSATESMIADSNSPQKAPCQFRTGPPGRAEGVSGRASAIAATVVYFLGIDSMGDFVVFRDLASHSHLRFSSTTALSVTDGGEAP
jgi:hypothetical protein